MLQKIPGKRSNKRNTNRETLPALSGRPVRDGKTIFVGTTDCKAPRSVANTLDNWLPSPDSETSTSGPKWMPFEAVPPQSAVIPLPLLFPANSKSSGVVVLRRAYKKESQQQYNKFKVLT
jgi:hypothetical protein